MTTELAYNGQTITEPGIYSKVPMSVYHSDCCDGPSVSSSGLREIVPPNGCPLKYWNKSYLNPDAEPEEVKDHFSIGRAVHTLLLSEKGFRSEYVIRPEKWQDWRTNAAKEWREQQMDAGKTVLLPSDLVDIEGMANRIANDKTFVDLLRGRIERSLFWKDPQTGIWLKARPDSLPADTIIADLKTTADASAIGCQRSIINYGYHIQLGLGVQGLELLTGQTVEDCVLLFIETKRPYAYNIKPIDQQMIHEGMRQIRAAVNVFAECWKSGNWPTYYDSMMTFSAPQWFSNQLDNEPSIPKEV